MSQAFTTNGYAYFNETYANAVGTAVLRISNNSSVNSNFQSFFLVSSTTSNQIWGGSNRADIIVSNSPSTVTSADALEWLKICLASSEPEKTLSNDRYPLVLDELFLEWVAQGIGYFGDTTAQPLFLPNTRTIQIKVGKITNWPETTRDYYGFGLGVNLYYGDCRNGYISGIDGKTYKVHICRYASDNSILIRLDNPTITTSQTVASYQTKLFRTVTIGTTTYDIDDITIGQGDSVTLNGSILLFWRNITSNPFGTTAGALKDVTFNYVSRGPYGAEFSNPSGRITLSMIDRVERFVDTGLTPTVAAGSSYFKSISGMQNNDSWSVFVVVDPFPSTITNWTFNVTKTTGGFTIQNTGNDSRTFRYWVLRS